MKTILLGSDFMYNSKGDLVPIQINTAVSHNIMDRIEDDSIVYDLTELKKMIIDRKISTVFYIGLIQSFYDILSKLCDELNITIFYYKIGPPSLTVPNIVDKNDTLIIRSAYDTNAIVDDEYCRNRAEFLNLIRDTDFSSDFVYLNYSGKLVNNINKIIDNGVHPNFILKSVYPDYDRNIYPKLYKVNSYSELNKITKNVNSTYFLTTFHYNPDNLYNNSIVNIRSLNILFPPDLNSIPIGAYTKISSNNCDILPEYDENFELKTEFRNSYLTSDDYNKEESEKVYLNKNIILKEHKNKMNDILTSLGKIIIETNS